MFFGCLRGRVTVAGNFRRALWSKDAGGNGGGGAGAAPGRRRARLRGPGRGLPAPCLQHRLPHAGQPRRGRRSRAGGVSPRSPGDRRVSGGVQALHLALRDHLAPVPQPARLRRAADGAGPGGGGDADRSAERRWRRGGPDGAERDGGRAPPGDRRAARRAPHRGRPARSGGPVLRGDRRHARADARHRALAPAPGAPGAQREAGEVPAMTCDHARAMFSELTDRALPDAERAACEAHLAACPDCRREWETFQRMLALLHGMPRLRAPAGFADRVLAAAHPTPWHRRLLRTLFLPLPVKLPLEAAALVLVAVGAVYLVQRSPELQQAARRQTPPPPLREEKAQAPVREPARTRQSADEPAVASQPAAERRAPTPARKEAPATARDQAAIQRYTAPEPKTRDRPAAAPERSDHERFLARAPAPPTVSGRLVVQDRDTAELALAELAARVGATEVSRWRAEEATIVELELPRSAYPELARALGRLGARSPDRQPPELPPRGRVVPRLPRRAPPCPSGRNRPRRGPPNP